MRSLFRLWIVMMLFCFFISTTAFGKQVAGGQLVDVPSLAVVRRLGLKPLGSMDSTKRLDIDLALPLRNQGELATLLQKVYDPQSPKYRHYLTPSKFTNLFGPTQQSYDSLVSYAKGNGFAVTFTDPNRLTVGLKASVRVIQRTFHVQMVLYKRPQGSGEFYAPNVEPTLDCGCALAGIYGLSDYFGSRPEVLTNARLTTSGGVEGTGSGPNGSFWGYDFRDAYAPGVTFNGKGQTLGLLELYSGFDPSDISAYKANTGLQSNTPIDAHPCGGYGGGLGNYPNEVEDDIEMALAMAPGLDSIVVFEGDDPANANDALIAMIGDSAVKQFSSSWMSEADYGYFQEMAMDGQTYFNSSGDTGPWIYDGSYYLPVPIGDTVMTVVGGTDLTTNGAGGPCVSETVWNEDNGTKATGSGYASSTGVPWPIPSFQQSVQDLSAVGGSTQWRNAPDVGIVSTGIYLVYNGIVDDGGRWDKLGRTALGRLCCIS